MGDSFIRLSLNQSLKMSFIVAEVAFHCQRFISTKLRPKTWPGTTSESDVPLGIT